MKNTILQFITLLFFNGALFSQGYGNTMIFGYEGGNFSPNNDDYGLNILKFSDGGLEMYDDQESDLEFTDTDAAISDAAGNLLFYFNGVSVYDASHHVMLNGENLNTFNQFGYDLPQGGIIVPSINQAGKYFLIYAKGGYIAPWGLANIAVCYAVIDMAQQIGSNGLGKVVARDQLIVADSLEYGKLAVVQHANGRDWWLIIGEAHHNGFYRVLIDGTGPHLLGKQSVGTDRVFSFGQATFSANGEKYTLFGAFDADGLTRYVDIYDFDRCSGLFSNHEHFELVSFTSGAGSAISANSRWLYIALFDKLLKYDLEASPVEPTQELIAEYEPFEDPFPTNFFLMFLAPDDKIYITTTSGSRTLHVIHKPDEPGTACAFEQHGIRLNCYNARSLPTYANYRLGPIDGSPCDNLGFNNNPVAWWRYEQDTAQHALFEFRDLSYHEPATWHWDFGDGNTSIDRHPLHQYATTGTYQVCLEVSNNYGSDTHCKTIYSTVAVRDNPEILKAVTVGPNPFRDRLAVALNVTLRSPVFRLYDQMGRLVREVRLAYGMTEVETERLSAGMYFWVVSVAGEAVKSGKVVKTER